MSDRDPLTCDPRKIGRKGLPNVRKQEKGRWHISDDRIENFYLFLHP